MNNTVTLAPPLQVAQWFNTKLPLSLDAVRGRVVAIHAFQMLCPGCVAEGLPQTLRLRHAFADRGLVVWGLHSVFEHHEAMGPQALQAFLHEYRLDFPVAVDAPSSAGPVPRTMAAWQLRGTPSLVLVDRQGRLRLNHFGHLDDLRLGAMVEQLLSEPTVASPDITASPPTAAATPATDGGSQACSAEGCPLPQ